MAETKILLTKKDIEQAAEVINMYKQLPKDKQLMILGLIQGLAATSKETKNE